MANYCDLYASITHTDPVQYYIVKNEYTIADDPNKCILSAFRPMPTGQYDQQTAYDLHGTKWYEGEVEFDDYNQCVTLSGGTAWKPPEELFRWLAAGGWDIEAQYCEDSSEFCGEIRSDGDDIIDEYYEGSQYHEYCYNKYGDDHLERILECHIDDRANSDHDALVEILTNWRDESPGTLHPAAVEYIRESWPSLLRSLRAKVSHRANLFRLLAGESEIVHASELLGLLRVK